MLFDLIGEMFEQAKPGWHRHKMLRTEEENKQHFPNGGIFSPNGRKSLSNEMEGGVKKAGRP
jgi:hypothetical protein